MTTTASLAGRLIQYTPASTRLIMVVVNGQRQLSPGFHHLLVASKPVVMAKAKAKTMSQLSDAATALKIDPSH